MPHATPAEPIWRRIPSRASGQPPNGRHEPCRRVRGNLKLISLILSDLPLISDTPATNLTSRYPEPFSSWFMARVRPVVCGFWNCPFTWEGDLLLIRLFFRDCSTAKGRILWSANIYPLIAFGVTRIGDRSYAYAYYCSRLC